MADTLRVLYVDDEPSLLDIGKLFLQRDRAFAVDTLTSALEALEQLKTEQYDAIISDYQMPDMDGITFLKQLKASGNTTPFIIFTGRGREEVVVEAFNNGADFYLQKGGEPKAQFAELAHKIKTAVSRQRTEKLAKDTERRLYDIINFLPDATFAIDTDGNVIAWNKAIEEMTGVSASDMLGKGKYEYSLPFYGERRPILIDLVSIPDEELTRGKYSVIKKEGDILIAETTLPRPLGRYSVLLGKATLLYNDKGEGIGAIESIRDITEQKRMQETMLESGRQLNAIATNIPGVIYRYFVNPDGTTGFDYISERSRQILGLENDKVTFFDRVTEGIVPKDRGRFLSSVQHSVNTKTLWEFDGQYVKPSGKKIWISAVSSPVIENKRLIFDGVIFDNTERKRAEEELVKKNEELNASYEQIAAAEEELRANLDEMTRAEQDLRESEEKYRTLVEKANEAIMIAQNDVFVFANRRMSDLLGVPVADLEGKPFIDFIWPGDRELVMANYKKRISGDTISDAYDFRIIGEGGRLIWVFISAAAIQWKGKPATLNLVTDITGRKQAEEALRESEEKYRLIFEDSPLGHLYFDEKGVIVACNDKFIQIIGSSRDVLVGLNMLNLPDKNIVSAVQKALHGDYGLYEGVYSSVTAKKITPVRGLFAPMDVRGGRIPGGMGIFEDITERKEAEEALKESEQKYRDIFDNSVTGLFKTAPDGRMINANNALARMYGYFNAAEILKAGVNVGQMYANPEERAELLHILAEKGIAENFETQHLKRDGTRFWVSITARILRDTEGTVLFYEGTNIDITRRKLAEEALRESELKYRSLIESSSDAIFCVDQNGEYKFTNLVFASTFNKTPEYFIGKTFWDIYPKEHADHRQLTNLKVFETGITQTIEVEVPLPDTILYFIAKANPIKDETGKVILNLTHATDITERKRAERAIQQANQKLTLLSSITRHDINNQLTVLQGYLELLEIKQQDNNLIDYCQKAITAAQRIYAMIRFTKEYESLGISDPVWHDTRALIDTAIKQAPLGEVMVKNDLPAGSELFADPLIVKVCYNLMDNALRYGGKITSIRFSVKERDSDHVVVCEDDGVGVSVEDKEKIFNRGFGKNTGLGLALSREILLITGITIRESGEPGKGARFEITVPKGMWRSRGNNA